MIDRKQLGDMAKTLNGMPVWGCLPNSAASEAGLRYGDIVLFANGCPTANASEYVRARALCSEGVDLVVFRDGATFRIRLGFSEAIQQESMQGLSRDRLRQLSQHLTESKVVSKALLNPAVDPQSQN